MGNQNMDPPYGMVGSFDATTHQIIEITNISSSQNYEYWNIEPFLLETYEILKHHKSKDKQLYYHIKVLYVIANTLFRNKKFLASLNYLDLMNLYMHKNSNKYFKEFHLKYQLLLALNHNYIQNQEDKLPNIK